MEKEKNFIKKEDVFQGLKMNLTYEELGNICQGEFEKFRYYDFEILKSGLYKAYNREVSFEYFRTWCILVSNCIVSKNYSVSQINELMWDISWFFDGLSFEDEYNKKSFKLNIALLKHYNHKFENLLKRTKTSFQTKGVEKILLFDHSNDTMDSCVYKAIIKDNSKKSFDLRYVDDAFFEFDENVNYIFADEVEFEKIFKRSSI